MNPLIIERSGPSPRALTPELTESLLSLKGHPGWEYFLDKLRFQREGLRAKLEQESLGSLDQVHNLRAGIRWTRWLEDQMLFLSATNKERPVFTPTPVELDLFREIQAATTMVGTSEG